MSTGILIVGNFFSEQRQGSRQVCEDLAPHLESLGWGVITTSHKAERLSRLADTLLTIWKQRTSYSIAQVDVFSGKAFFMAESACWLLRKLRKPIVLTLHGGALPSFAKRWPRRVRGLLESVAAVTVPSKYLLESMLGYRKDLRLIRNGIDLTQFRYRSRVSLEPRLVWVRAFHNIYNPGLAVRVAALVRERYPDLRLTMVGPDKGDGSFQEVEALVKRSGLSATVRMIGGVGRDEIPSWLDVNDIFINTTNVDNAPVSVVESMACGLCVVSTNVGGLPYLLENERDSLLVDADNPEQMAGAVLRLLEDKSLAQRISAEARMTAESFDWPIVLRDWESLLGSVIARRDF